MRKTHTCCWQLCVFHHFPSFMIENVLHFVLIFNGKKPKMKLNCFLNEFSMWIKLGFFSHFPTFKLIENSNINVLFWLFFYHPQKYTTMAHLNIIHFNDIYNVEPNSSREPIGGAARFLTAVKSMANLNPLILFSGDAFSPSIRK